jgi:hypothetical protein
MVMARQVTITLDDETAAQLDAKARETSTPTDEVVLDAVRQWVQASEAPRPQPFKVNARLLHAREGVSFECVARLLGEQDEELFQK